MTHRILISILFFLFYQPISLYSQSYFQPKRVLPSSPEAKSIEKFVEYPVSQFTGVPSINIPIYSIEFPSFSLPISASYHASGVKVDDIASNIGIGWSLLAGGSISIQVNGILDELSQFNHQHPKYNKIKNLSFNTSSPSTSVSCSGFVSENALDYYTGDDIEYLKGLHFGLDDSEPDMYSFSFGNQSGKFFQDENGIFRTIPYSKMKIVRKMNGTTIQGYVITDENGNVFEFSQLEESLTITANPCSPNPYNNSLQGYSRSYHLTKVKTPLSDSIELKYSENGYSVELQKQFSRVRYLDPFSPCVTGPGGTGNADLYSYNCSNNSTMSTGSVKLDSIVASNGVRMVFVYSSENRQDLPVKSLDSIKVREKISQKIIKNVEFVKGYWSGRLQLKSLKEVGKPPYQFVYNNNPMPPRLSFSQDHWGYYNGAGNTTLLPLDEYLGFNTGANREPNPEVIQFGTLKKIIYPTGGAIDYYYEPNDYFVPTVTTKKVKESGATLASLPDTTLNYSFIVPTTSSNHTVSYINTFNGTNMHNDYCKIKIYGPNGYQLQLDGSDMSKRISLQPGNYTLEIENVGSLYNADVTIYWFNEISVPPHNEIGGGIRIKEIVPYDCIDSIDLKKSYEYVIPGTTNSSGISMYTPEYYEINDETRFSASSCLSYPNMFTCQTRVQSSSSRAPLSFSNGYHVGYTDVIEYSKSKSENGYIHSKFIVDNGNSIGAPSSPPYPPQINYDWVNGSPLEQNIYRSVGGQIELVKKLKSTYNYTSFNPGIHTQNLFTIYGAKSMLVQPPRYAGYCDMGCANEVLSAIYFGVQRYQLYSSWHYLTKTEEFVYGGPTSYLYTATEYFYDNPLHLKPTRILSSNSEGSRTLTSTKFPLDYNSPSVSDATGAGILQLQNANVVSAEIEKTIRESNEDGTNERVIGSVLNVYHPLIPVVNSIKTLELNSGTTNFTPSSVSGGVVSFDNKYKVQALYSINDRGRIIEQSRANDVKQSYVWDYNTVYPIAEVINATIDEIAYTSFESDGKGSWSFGGSPLLDNTTLSGQRAYDLSQGDIARTINPTKAYNITYWRPSNLSALTISGTQNGYPIIGKTVNGWKYFEHKVSGIGTIVLSGTGLIDELRLYPIEAQMTTYSYEPLVGLKSICDIKNRFSYYEYDGLQRLIFIKDQDHNILKQINYNYVGQVENCTLFGNAPQSGSFYRNNCPSGYGSSNVNYLVPINSYFAATQQEADQMAAADVASNGQAYANQVGTCTISSTCNTSNCIGANKKCVYGICETGIKVYTSSIQIGSHLYECTYHFEWSDGSWSQNFIEESPTNCQLINPE